LKRTLLFLQFLLACFNCVKGFIMMFSYTHMFNHIHLSIPLLWLLSLLSPFLFPNSPTIFYVFFFLDVDPM
jgi:hypothetical protein